MSRRHKKVSLTKSDFLKIGTLSTALTILFVGMCLFLLFAFYQSFLVSLASNDEVKTVLSPDGHYQAIAFLRCEGAWGGCTPAVSILKPSEELPRLDRGNVFIGCEHSSFIEIQWLSEQKLLIRYTVYNNNLPLLQVKQKDDIQIEYQLAESE